MYKVAICDDNPADLQLITDYLTEPEFHYPLELSSFHDGVELAQAYKKEGQYDLIILDMMMDRLNGIETALKIRKVDQNVAILIVTATVEYAIEGYKINAARYIVKRNGEEISLPRKEFALLTLLMSDPGRLFSREEIYSRVWGEDVVVGDRTIDVHIRKLRQKIGDEHIITVKGVGYKYEK